MTAIRGDCDWQRDRSCKRPPGAGGPARLPDAAQRQQPSTDPTDAAGRGGVRSAESLPGQTYRMVQ